MALFAEAHRDRKKRPRAFTAADFMPYVRQHAEGAEPPELPDELAIERFRSAANYVDRRSPSKRARRRKPRAKKKE